MTGKLKHLFALTQNIKRYNPTKNKIYNINLGKKKKKPRVQ